MNPVFQSAGASLSEVRHLADFIDPIYWLYQHGIARGLSTGWAALDALYSVRPREWTLITGIPGHGKSALLDGLMVHLAKTQKWNWAVFSAENLPHERHAADLAAQYIGKPFSPGPRERMTYDEFRWACRFIDSRFAWLNPPAEDCTIDRILKTTAALCDSEPLGIQGLVIDPWNELDHSRPGNVSETEYISEALSRIRRFAREHEIHVFIVAHPTKLQRIVKKGADPNEPESTVYPVPTPYDVSGSAHWRNKADNCLCVWRDVADPHYGADIHVQKIRFREVGQVGMAHLQHDRATNQFFDAHVARPPVFTPPELEMPPIGPVREPGCDDE